MLAEVAVGRVWSLPQVPPGPSVESGFLAGGCCECRVYVPSWVREIEVLRAAEKSHFCEQCALPGAGVCTCTRGIQS